jgi:hypothetical protein
LTLATIGDVVVLVSVVAAVTIASIIIPIAVLALAFVLRCPLVLSSCWLVVACCFALIRYDKLWHLFYRYFYIFLLELRKTAYCTKVHYFIKYQNNCFRDPIKLLSMDIAVERFLEIGASDLLVSTQQLQDPLYTEV